MHFLSASCLLAVFFSLIREITPNRLDIITIINHPDPDYSCAYVIVKTSGDTSGHGFTFTLGRGTEIVVQAIKSMTPLVVGKELQNIFDDFAGFWKSLTRESQIMWLGPEKGVVHLAVGAIVNALWDLWAKLEDKPLWKLLVDMDPAKLLSTIDFTYVTDVLTKEEALEILNGNLDTKSLREAELKAAGYPAYTTQVGWMGYSDHKIRKLCREFLNKGFKRFKIKVGVNLDDDKRRLTAVRDVIGYKNMLMVDANQCWDVPQAITWMKELVEFAPTWIEEPTSPDDALGHATIAKALNPLGIGVATGENCCNRVIFKQLMQAGGCQYCQIDACRLGGVNEVMLVILLAAKFKIPVCPHAGGVGLCELVQHLAIFDYICVSATMDDRVVEFVDHLHEHFKYPVVISNAKYMPPQAPGYSTEMKEESLKNYEYPHGSKWQELFKEGLYAAPS